MAAAKKKPEAGKRLDLTFLSFVLILLTTGLVMLFSASYAYSYEYYGNSYKFITRQAAFAAAGVALMLLISKLDYHFWRRFAWITYVLAIGMLAVLLVARLTDGFLFSLVATVVSVIGVNYAFTYPYFAFNFTITGYPLTFVTMFAVSIVVGMLTDQVKRQERVKSEAEKEKMKANLLRSVSHDLRTPLTSIIGSSSAVLENYDQFSDEVKKDLIDWE